MTDGAACEIADALRSISNSIDRLTEALYTDKVGHALDGLAAISQIAEHLSDIADRDDEAV